MNRLAWFMSTSNFLHGWQSFSRGMFDVCGQNEPGSVTEVANVCSVGHC